MRKIGNEQQIADEIELGRFRGRRVRQDGDLGAGEKEMPIGSTICAAGRCSPGSASSVEMKKFAYLK